MVVLPAPLGPSRPKISPRCDAEVDAANRLQLAVALAQVADLDRRAATPLHQPRIMLSAPRAAAPPAATLRPRRSASRRATSRRCHSALLARAFGCVVARVLALLEAPLEQAGEKMNTGKKTISAKPATVTTLSLRLAVEPSPPSWASAAGATTSRPRRGVAAVERRSAAASRRIVSEQRSAPHTIRRWPSASPPTSPRTSPGTPLLRGVSFKLERARADDDRRSQRRRQDDAAADARRRGCDRRRRAVASPRACASRCTISARRASAASRCATTCCPAAPPSWRSRRGCAKLEAGDGGRRDRPGDARPLRAARRPSSSTTAATSGATAPTDDRARPRLPRRGPRPRRSRRFSGGELTRASLARALATRPDLLLLDEPTNHLDIESLEWLEQTLVALDAAIVLVAHDRWFLETVGTAVLELEAGRSRFFPGTVARLADRAGRARAGTRPRDRAPAGRGRAARALRRALGRRHARAPGAVAREGARRRSSAIERATDRRRRAVVRVRRAERSGRVDLRARGRPDRGRRAAARAARARRAVARARRARLARRAATASGKTTLIETLARPRGRWRAGQAATRAQRARSATSRQHADELGDERHACSRRRSARPGCTPDKARALLGRFLFSGEDAEKPLAGLSGGERRRLSLAILVSGGANVLILDEPTNHLDLESREALEDALKRVPRARCCSSPTTARCSTPSARARSRSRSGKLRSYVGGWPEYLRVREERKATGEEPRSPPARRVRRREREPLAKRAQARRAGREPSKNRAARARRTRRTRGRGMPRRRSPRSRRSSPTRRHGRRGTRRPRTRPATPRPSAPSSRRTRSSRRCSEPDLTGLGSRASSCSTFALVKHTQHRDPRADRARDRRGPRRARKPGDRRRDSLAH